MPVKEVVLIIYFIANMEDIVDCTHRAYLFVSEVAFKERFDLIDSCFDFIVGIVAAVEVAEKES